MTHEEYELALAELEALWDAKPFVDTVHFENLVDAIVAYEDEHYPIAEPSPEAMAEFRRDQMM